MSGNKVKKNTDAHAVGGVQHFLQILKGAVARGDFGVLAHIIAGIFEGRVVNGVDPQSIAAQTFYIGQLCGDALQVADAVSVGVIKGLGIDLIKDCVFQPAGRHMLFLRFPREGMTLQQVVFDIGKGFFLAFVPQHGQQEFQLVTQLLTHEHPFPAV